MLLYFDIRIYFFAMANSIKYSSSLLLTVVAACLCIPQEKGRGGGGSPLACTLCNTVIKCDTFSGVHP